MLKPVGGYATVKGSLVLKAFEGFSMLELC